MILSKNKKFINLNPPKTGSGYRERHLKRFADVIVSTHQELKCRHWTVEDTEKYLINNGLNPDDYFWFTFVRNPWDRVVSWYNMRINHAIMDGKQTKKALLTEDRFSEFVGCIARNNKFKNYTLRNGVELDYIGMLESIEDDLDYLSDRLNLNINLKTHSSHLSSYHADINELWSNQAIDLVAETECNVINQFNYKFKGN